jgi:hypothetical protein
MSFYKPKETMEPRIEKPIFGAYPDPIGPDGWKRIVQDLTNAKHHTMKPNPTDPHHVLLSLITDLHSTNLSRQKELLELRDQNRKLMSDSNGYRELNEDRLKVTKKIQTLAERPTKADLQNLINEIALIHLNR